MKFPFVIKVNLISLWKLVRWARRFLLHKKPEKRNFGWKRDKWDERDIYYKTRRPVGKAPLSTGKVNINAFPWRYDQGNIGSCVGNGTAAAFRRNLQVNKKPDFAPSRLFAYYNARTDENKKEDSGASIRDSFKAVNKYGLCSEVKWPYIITRFEEKPSHIAYEEAEKHQSIKYERIFPQSKEYIQDALVNGFCIVFGIILHESFMSETVAKTGIVPNPKPWEEEIGGHCMVIFDYDEKGVWVLNSWDSTWGYEGTCYITWEYILSKHASDFWVFYETE